MIRLLHVYYPKRVLVLAVSEALLIVLVLIAAAVVNHGSDTELMLAYEQGYLKIGVAAVICQLCMYYYDVYEPSIINNSRETITRLIQVVGTLCLVQVLLYYIIPSIRLDQGTFILGILFLGIALSSWRTLFLVMNRIPRLGTRTVFLGTGPLAATLAREIGKRAELGMCLLGYIDSSPSPAAHVNGLTCLGGFGDLANVVQRERVEQIIVTMEDRRGKLPVEHLLQIKTRGVMVVDGADIYEAVLGRVPIHSLRLSWLLFSPGFCLSTPVLIYKRLLSFILSTLFLILALPLMAIIALAIRLDSPGPIIFRQKRMGQDGKAFALFKFRSMQWSGKVEESTPAQANDKRFTRVGRWIRRVRLDELPQLYNILRGDMYFVGPRPFVPKDEEVFLREIPFYAQRLTIRPGATGWAQVNYGYCSTIEDNITKLEYDLFYIKNVSVGLDVLTLFKTLKILVLGRGGR